MTSDHETDSHGAIDETAPAQRPIEHAAVTAAHRPDEHAAGAGHAHGDDHAGRVEGHDGHGHDGHGHDEHGHDDMALGPVDVAAWGAGILGAALGLVTAFCFALSTGLIAS